MDSGGSTIAPRGAGAALLAIALMLSACASGSDEATNVVDDAAGGVSSLQDSLVGDDVEPAGRDLRAMIDEPDLSSLYSAMDLIGFGELAQEEAVTFFAPNDQAFSAMDADAMSELLADPEQLRGVLLDHLVAETLTTSDLGDVTEVTSLGGLTLVFETSGPVPTVNGIEIVRSDITLDNGVVHVIDGVLLDEAS